MKTTKVQARTLLTTYTHTTNNWRGSVSKFGGKSRSSFPEETSKPCCSSHTSSHALLLNFCSVNSTSTSPEERAAMAVTAMEEGSPTTRVLLDATGATSIIGREI